MVLGSSGRPATALARLKASQALSSPRPSHSRHAAVDSPRGIGMPRPAMTPDASSHSYQESSGTAGSQAGAGCADGALGALKLRRLASMAEQLTAGGKRPMTAPA